VIRIAAVGDIHLGLDSAGSLRRELDDIADCADVLVVAGDLTNTGTRAEAQVVARELADLPVPVIAVLGNHDYHCGNEAYIRRCLEEAGVTVLEGEAVELDVDGSRLAVAGTKGFGGGFAGACATDFGEPEMKAFVHHTKTLAGRLSDAMASMDGDVRLVLMHYSPIPHTLRGEPPEIYPFLGSYLLGEAVDTRGADLILHGHAHRGVEKGVTPGGILVRNVAQPVIKHVYNLYHCHASEQRERVLEVRAARGHG
jgi:Icc-related predicted phosphoesterase